MHREDCKHEDDSQMKKHFTVFNFAKLEGRVVIFESDGAQSAGA